MFDTATPRGRLIDAALKLAAEKPWDSVALTDISTAAGMSLAELSGEFGSKSQIIVAFAKAADAEMLRQAQPPAADQPRRDALFEVIMNRLDTLAPYKTALRSIVRSAATDPSLLRSFFTTQGWMLEAAGVSHDGLPGMVRAAGLGAVYASVMQTWLSDDDPGMARTMAVLDQRLRRGETMMSAVSGACDTAGRVMAGLRAGLCRGRSASSGAATSPPPPRSATTPPVEV